MYKVLIADDELKICKLIQCLIDWEAKDMKVIGIVHNGQEVLEIAKSDKPDIIITDIRMPELDGLELIQQLKAIQPDISFVIISGYRQFEYARKALQFGAEDYLLKPIKENELNRVLDRIVAEKKQQMKNVDEQNQLRESSQKQTKKMQEMFVCDLAKGRISEFHLNKENLEKEYFCSFPHSCFALMGIKLDFEGDQMSLTEIQDILKKRVGAIVDNNLELLENLVFYNAVIDSIFYSFWNFEASVERLLRHENRHILSDIRNMCSGERLSVHVTMGISEVTSGYESLPNKGAQVKTAIENRIIQGVDRIINYQKQDIKPEINDYLNLPWRKNLLDGVESRNRGAILQILEELKLKLHSEEINDGSFLYAVWREVIEIVFLGYRNCFDTDQIEKIRSEFLISLNNCYSLGMMGDRITKKIERLLTISVSAQESKNKKPIQKAEQYIQLHYMKPLTLEEVGKYVGLNPAYFSSVFKQETGMSFLELLTTVRIRKAKELLMDRERTIRDIADSVGYQDEKYFSRVFKKTVGLTPSEYRKIYC